MSDNSKNSDELLKHLQEERSKQKVSLSGLIDSSNNSIPSILGIGTIVSAIISCAIVATTWVLNKDSEYDTLMREINSNTQQVQELSNNYYSFKDATLDTLENNAQINSTSFTELSNRLSESVTQLTTDARLQNSEYQQRLNSLESDLNQLQTKLSNLRSGYNENVSTLNEVVNKITSLENKIQSLREELQ